MDHMTEPGIHRPRCKRSFESLSCMAYGRKGRRAGGGSRRHLLALARRTAYA